MPCELAPIVVTPIPVVVAKPPTLGAFAMVATLDADELQCVLSVMSCVDVSLNVPVAVNCCVLPTETDGFAGEIATETNVPVPTISVAVPLMPELVAVIVTVPAFLP